jgi:hypothetical protein
LLAAVASVLVVVLSMAMVPGVMSSMQGKKTVDDRMAEFGSVVKRRLAPELVRIGLAWPPQALILVGLKQERRLEVWASGDGRKFRLLKRYPILGASGGPGPKLRQGDLQVPEGLYAVESLNPNSRYHLALRVGYPNEFDRAKGRLDGRDALGGDIMIHGRDCSIGCLAMGDPAAEDLFVLAAATGIDRVQVILAPVDFRHRQDPDRTLPAPAWMPELYAIIRAALLPLQE